MLVTMPSPSDVSIALARRVRERRLERGWTQLELAGRSNVALDTLKKFEHTGQISVPRLVRLAIALGCANDLERLFQLRTPRSLDDLTRTQRQRGRTMRRADGAL